VNPSAEARLSLARAALDPEAAILARALVPVASDPVEAPAGVVALERYRGLTLAVEVDPPPPHRRWRFFLFYCLIKLAARVYPFRFEIYRTRQPWE
jgi:hypothetical protein